MPRFPGLPLVLALAAGLGCSDAADRRTQAVNLGDLIAAPAVTPPTVVPAVDPATDRPRLIPAPVVEPAVRGAEQVDVYVQRPATVDVLWVLDDSASMIAERNRLAGDFEAFLEMLVESNGQIDYRVGVTSTNVGPTGLNGRLRGPFIDTSTPNPREVFADQLAFPETRTRQEQGLEAARLAVVSPPIEPGSPAFLRPDAALAIVFLTDEDDSSYGSPAHYARALRSAKGPGNEALVTVSAIAGPVPDGCIPPGQEHILWSEANPAERYLEVVEATGGTFGSICEDFGPTLERVVKTVRTLRRTFPLSLTPISASLRVKVCPRENDCGDNRLVPRDDLRGWRYDDELQAVVFDGEYLPPPAWMIRIEYGIPGGAQ
jgi:hypothetical protein